MKRKTYKTKSKFKGSSKELRKKTKKLLQKLGRRSRKFIHPICKICRKERTIRVIDKTTFTKEFFENYVCLICKDTWKHKLLEKGLIIRIDENGKIIWK